MIIEWVNVIGFGELQSSDFEIGETDQSSVSLDAVWTKSRHHVFKRISGLVKIKLPELERRPSSFHAMIDR